MVTGRNGRGSDHHSYGDKLCEDHYDISSYLGLIIMDAGVQVNLGFTTVTFASCQYLIDYGLSVPTQKQWVAYGVLLHVPSTNSCLSSRTLYWDTFRHSVPDNFL